MSVSIGGKIVTDGLVIHYDALNGKSYPGSGTTWYDLTPYNNTGSLNNGNNPVTISNGYASFTGTDNDKYVNFPCMKHYCNNHMDLSCRKGFHPYKFIDNNDKLNYNGLPLKKNFMIT
jgi:hypothetical protein